MANDLEERARRIVRARMRRGERKAVAKAAGHDPSWVSHWLKGDVVKNATVDEIGGMLTAVGSSLSRLTMQTAADDLDWELLALVAKLEDRKPLARKLIARLIAGEVVIVEPQSTERSGPHPRLAAHK